jgi:starch phosphorylase
VQENGERRVRMAHLAFIGSHCVNGVSHLHTELMRKTVFHDLAQTTTTRILNKTNGITFRRWLFEANRPLSELVIATLGERVLDEPGRLLDLGQLAGDEDFVGRFRHTRHVNKSKLAGVVQAATGVALDPEALFDVHVKRIHEYKRQLLNALRIIVLYNRLRDNPGVAMTPRTFFFAGKAAPAYRLAKLIIKFINNLAGTIDGDPIVQGRLRVVFLTDYCVSLAERLIPAADVSNQISTAGYEASGTSNMKFMMNGALTIGTRDGATIEMAEEAGEENFFLFGLTADGVASSRSWYNPHWHYDNEPETRAALDLIFSDHFSRYEPGIFVPLRDALLTHGDHYMHLADLKSYLEADQRLTALYGDGDAWARKAILNVACCGKFSSDHTIAQYATEIWRAKPCPVP